MRLFAKKSLLAALIAVPTSTLAFDIDAIRETCEAKWPGDFFLQKGCLDLQRDSFVDLQGAISGLPDNIASKIRASCAAQWSDDFFMQKGCVDLQVEAWRALNG